MNIITPALQRLVTWTHAPEPAQLPEILSALTDADLVVGLAFFKTEPAGRLAWAEYGRRVGFINFRLTATVLNGRVVVRYEGDAKPLHHGAIFEMKQ